MYNARIACADPVHGEKGENSEPNNSGYCVRLGSLCDFGQTDQAQATYMEVLSGAPRIMTLVKTSTDSGKVYVSGKVWRAAYQVQGIKRRWDFGENRYAITPSPEGVCAIL